MQKARDQFQPDVLRFKKAKAGGWLLVIYKRSDMDLRELYSGVVDLENDSANTLRIKWRGADKGTRPIFKGRPSAVVSVPNDYTVELDEPALGKLIYDAKSGLVGN